MKRPIYFMAMDDYDKQVFTEKTSYWPGVQFGGIKAYYTDEAGNMFIMGMVAFDSWAPRTVMAHWFIRHSRCIQPLWDEAVKYIAGTGRKAILGCTPGNLTNAIKSIKHLGWHELYRVKDGWDEGVDLVISEYTINEQECTSRTVVRGATANEHAAGRAVTNGAEVRGEGRVSTA